MMSIDVNEPTTNLTEAQIIVDETQINPNMAPLKMNIPGTLLNLAKWLGQWNKQNKEIKIWYLCNNCLSLLWILYSEV